MKVKELSESQKNDLAKIFESISEKDNKIETEWLICSPEMEQEAKRIASVMTKPCKVKVLERDEELL